MPCTHALFLFLFLRDKCCYPTEVMSILDMQAVTDTIIIIDISEGTISEGLKTLPNPTSSGCAEVHDGYLYLIEGVVVGEEENDGVDT